ncbi:MAG: LapA family protein [Phascolarctobacterium sp.]|nr:LapA family protein [Phascolarctobacterium sp.]
MVLLMVVVIVSILVALFAMQNAMVVELNFIFWEFTASLVVVIVSAFALGMLVAMCFMLYMKAKHYMKDRKMQEELKNLQAENAKLTERITMLQHTQIAHDNAGLNRNEEIIKKNNENVGK